MGKTIALLLLVDHVVKLRSLFPEIWEGVIVIVIIVAIIRHR